MLIFRLLQAAGHERPVAALWFVIKKIFDRIRGRVMASLVGWPNSYLGAGSKILGTASIVVEGQAYINRYAWIEAVHTFADEKYQPSILIGKGLSVSDRLHITSINRVEIGDNCLFGSGVLISDHNHGSYSGTYQSKPICFPVKRKLISRGPVIIGSNVWLGDNVIVIGPVQIGSGVVVGANTVVTKDIPDNVIVVGVPAQIVKRFNDNNGEWESVTGFIDRQGQL